MSHIWFLLTKDLYKKQEIYIIIQNLKRWLINVICSLKYHLKSNLDMEIIIATIREEDIVIRTDKN